ncbi:MAG: endonuclease/exonuclease/phosphatase family protein [Bacteroidetes bacterium]|nr:endonuclease/exonuclease/phosphatase family protein [Bacteroidota bacterium]
MKYLSSIIFTLGLLFLSCSEKGNAQSQAASNSQIKGLTVAFYNVENLFDIYDNPEKDDEQFLPEGEYKWTSEKYVKKLDNLARVIKSMGSNGPDILGIAEVENKLVLEDLTQLTELKDRKYAIVHEESMDMRGIDVGLIYDPAVFVYTSHQAFNVEFPEEPDYTSRPVLLVEGKVNQENLYIIVNHWPSRRGGPEESEPRRLNAAKKVKEVISIIQKKDDDPNILIMGDFNDDPFNKSLVEVLNASSEENANASFFNPMFALHNPDSSGTLTYRGKWNLFDQILVSKGLMDKTGQLKYISQSAAIHNPEFMQVGGDSPAKDMPRRAIYRDEFQEDGFSDHFPVLLKLSVNK